MVLLVRHSFLPIPVWACPNSSNLSFSIPLYIVSMIAIAGHFTLVWVHKGYFDLFFCFNKNKLCVAIQLPGRTGNTFNTKKRVMKKIGILFGQERSFPMAFIERVNGKGVSDIVAEPVRIDKVVQGEPCGYDVIIDRISQDVPFYRAYLKNAALTGTAVVNNPFWWSADEKFFNNALATKIGVAVPKTVLLPSHQLPPDTSDNSFRNLAYPLDWESIFAYVGWPAFFKPFAGGGWKNVYRLHNPEEFFRAYSETGQLVMMLQEEVKFDMYFRCYCIDQRHVKIMNYEPRNPYHLRYVTEWSAPKEILQKVEEGVLTLNQYL